MVLNVLVEDRSFQGADVADAESWHRQLDLQFAVLADTERAWANVWGDPNNRQFVQHSYTLVDGAGLVLWREVENARAGPVLERIIEQLEMLD
ncbi:MAG: hypothetical protein ACI9U2_000123 [Bradymonadia bacterium]